jgi:hypothetical protein
VGLLLVLVAVVWFEVVAAAATTVCLWCADVSCVLPTDGPLVMQRLDEQRAAYRLAVGWTEPYLYFPFVVLGHTVTGFAGFLGAIAAARYLPAKAWAYWLLAVLIGVWVLFFVVQLVTGGSSSYVSNLVE